MSGTESTDQQDPSVVTVCRLCGKVKRQGRKGTMTAWIFGGSACTCDSGGAFVPETTAGPEAAKESSAPQLPNLSPTYEALSFIGEGGMGSVWKVRENASGKLFAVKILRRELAQDLGSVKRFEQEVRAASELTHPNLVFVHGSDRMSDGTPYMVMRFIDGVDLSDVVKDEIALPLFRVMPIFAQATEALKHAHAQGIIHRDLKPSNIIVSRTEDGREHIRIVDFGIAKIVSPEHNSDLTQTGEVFGSPLYMSPEQCDGAKIEVTSDIYSLGCVVYFMICGQPPFNDRTPLKIMMSHLQAKPKPMTTVRPDMFIPKELNTIVMKCLEKSPKQRYPSMDALLRDINIVNAKYPARSSIGTYTSAHTGLHKAADRRQKVLALAGVSITVAAAALFAYSTYAIFKTPSASTTARNDTQTTKLSVLSLPLSTGERPAKSKATAMATRGESALNSPAGSDDNAFSTALGSDTTPDKSTSGNLDDSNTKVAALIPSEKKGRAKDYLTLCMDGQEKERAHDINGAINDLTASIKANPMKDLKDGDKTQRGYMAISCQHLGFIYCTRGMYPEGIAMLTKAIELRPYYAPNFKNRALAYLKIKEYVLAQADFDKANELIAHPHPDPISDTPGEFQ